MPLSLEDQFPDIVSKAQRGLRLDDAALAAKSGVAATEISRIKSGFVSESDDEIVQKIAPALHLDTRALLEIGHERYLPLVPNAPATFAAFSTRFDADVTVNAYLVWDAPGGHAVLFDTGMNAKPIRQALQSSGARLDAIFLTHTHWDHVAAVDDLAPLTRNIFVPVGEEDLGTQTIEDGFQWAAGKLQVTARLTRGHSPGGMTYVVEGVTPMVAIVGDALFAGSQGGVAPDLYPEALRLNREHIFSLPDETILCPGHGPLTTVGQEKRHNPFYAGSAG